MHRPKQSFPSESVYWQDSVLPLETDFSKETSANKIEVSLFSLFSLELQI